MSVMFALLRYEYRRAGAMVLTIAAILGAFQVLLIFIGRTIQASRGFEQLAGLLPPFMRELAGPALAGVLSFQGVVCLGYFHLAPVAALIGLAISLGTTAAADIETGLMELLLSRPMPRHWIVGRAWITMLAGIGAVMAGMLLATNAGLAELAPPQARVPSSRLVFSLGGNLAMLAAAWGGIAIAVSAASRRRGAASAIVGIAALVAFLLDYVARAWKPARPFGWFSPFRYFEPMDLLMGKPLAAANIAVLAAVLVGSVAVAYAIFSRRDIQS